ncbi:hypothetical protein XU18_4748 [Perkinsela sp. CCAP 1560/4]|nr:hypothetical protein XU18_4748 [Perkinsela sp. CCAP 1560/4]|eukprot:KNH03940.1 hypothetical protein XU18_4748 [Perkinsela sp. CCAP 1560/4]
MLRVTGKNLLLPLIIRLATAAGMILGKTVVEAYKHEIKRIVFVNIKRIAAQSLRSSLVGHYINAALLAMQDGTVGHSPAIEPVHIMSLHEALKILGVELEKTQHQQRVFERLQRELSSDIRQYMSSAEYTRSSEGGAQSNHQGNPADPLSLYLYNKHDAFKIQRSLELRPEQILEAKKRFHYMMRQNGFLQGQFTEFESPRASQSERTLGGAHKYSYLREKLVSAYKLLIDPKWQG